MRLFVVCWMWCFVFFFKQKTAYEMRISYWSAYVCSSDLPDRCILVGAYALGKAQRVIAELRAAGHDAPIFIHGALQRLCDLYRDFGVELGELRLATGLQPADLAGQIVVAPPSALKDRWSSRLPAPITAIGRASGRERGCQNG